MAYVMLLEIGMRDKQKQYIALLQARGTQDTIERYRAQNACFTQTT